jgi:hypothetical protein
MRMEPKFRKKFSWKLVYVKRNRGFGETKNVTCFSSYPEFRIIGGSSRLKKRVCLKVCSRESIRTLNENINSTLIGKQLRQRACTPPLRRTSPMPPEYILQVFQHHYTPCLKRSIQNTSTHQHLADHRSWCKSNNQADCHPRKYRDECFMHRSNSLDLQIIRGPQTQNE